MQCILNVSLCVMICQTQGVCWKCDVFFICLYFEFFLQSVDFDLRRLLGFIFGNLVVVQGLLFSLLCCSLSFCNCFPTALVFSFKTYQPFFFFSAYIFSLLQIKALRYEYVVRREICLEQFVVNQFLFSCFFIIRCRLWF